MNKNTSAARRWPPARVAQWAILAVLVVTSELVAWSGHKTASYAVDGLAGLVYLGLRRWRRTSARSSRGDGAVNREGRGVSVG